MRSRDAGPSGDTPSSVRMNPGRVAALLVLGLLACDQSSVPFPAVGPFADLPSSVSFGMPARDVARLPGVELNDEGQYVALRSSTQWLYLFDSVSDLGPPHPNDRLIQIQVREEFRDSTALWSRWSTAVREASNSLGAVPECVRLGGPQFEVTRAEFVGSPAVSVGAQIDVSDDGLDHETFLIVAAKERYAPAEFESGFGHQRVDCSSVAGGVP